MKICGTCKESKDLSEFSISKGKPQFNCKVCHSEYRKKHYQDNKKKYISKASSTRTEYRNEYYTWLSGKSCVDCGNSDIRVLEHDHLSDKSFNVSSKIGTRKLSSLMEEIEKCDIVCANCHRIRTVTRGNHTSSKYAALV